MPLTCLLLLLLGCAPSPLDTACDQAWWFDADGDGFGGRADVWIGCTPPPHFVEGIEDCADNDAEAFPEAEERCNALDDDCDGQADNNPFDEDTWYRDQDGDGFGNIDNTQLGCTAPAGFVADRNDCDDTSNDVNPDADELCDDIDHNCDGSLDAAAVDGDVYYADVDGDGAGDPEVASPWCEAPESGWSMLPNDCDDSSPDIGPDAVEVVGNGLDDDCDLTTAD
jgi:hypothetical protein